MHDKEIQKYIDVINRAKNEIRRLRHQGDSTSDYQNQLMGETHYGQSGSGDSSHYSPSRLRSGKQGPGLRNKLGGKWDTPTKVSPEERGKYSGKTKAELLKAYHALKNSGPHPKGSPEYGRMRELAFAIRAKSDWGKVK